MYAYIKSVKMELSSMQNNFRVTDLYAMTNEKMPKMLKKKKYL